MPEDYQARMTLSEHLEELRGRLFKALIGLLVGAAICWIFKANLMDVVRWPLLRADYEVRFLALSPTEQIIAYLKISIVGGAIIASPWITFQLWRFIGAGLYPHERWLFFRYAGGATFLFLLGVSFSYFIMMPLILGVLLNFDPADAMKQEMQISQYISFFFKFTLAMGGSFQVPMIMRFLSATGIVDRSAWYSYRKYAIVGAFLVGALITPPDPLSQASAALPMILLYEIGILLIPSESNRTMEDSDKTDDTPDDQNDDEEPEEATGTFAE